MNCSLEVYIISLVYLKRTLAVFPGLLCAETAHNLIVISYAFRFVLLMDSVMLAHKFFDESCYKSEFYAYLASLSIPQLNLLEGWFLQILNYALFVSDEEYVCQYMELTDLVVPRLISEGVFLPPLLYTPADQSQLCSLHYQATPYSGVLEAQYQQWRQRSSILPVPPLIAVPVTVAVPTIPTIPAIPAVPAVPAVPTIPTIPCMVATISSLQPISSTIHPLPYSMVPSSSSLSPSHIQLGTDHSSSFSSSSSSSSSYYIPAGMPGTVYQEDGQLYHPRSQEFASACCMKTQPTFSCCLPTLAQPISYSTNVNSFFVPIPVIPSYQNGHSCCSGVYPIVVPQRCRGCILDERKTYA